MVKCVLALAPWVTQQKSINSYVLSPPPRSQGKYSLAIFTDSNSSIFANDTRRNGQPAKSQLAKKFNTNIK
jgi:hypothetical protein